jgi:hypothetical protein
VKPLITSVVADSSISNSTDLTDLNTATLLSNASTKIMIDLTNDMIDLTNGSSIAAAPTGAADPTVNINSNVIVNSNDTIISTYSCTLQLNMCDDQNYLLLCGDGIGVEFTAKYCRQKVA